MTRKMIAALVVTAFAAASTTSFGQDRAAKPGGVQGMQGMGGMSDTQGDKGMGCMVGGECSCMSGGMHGGMGGGMMGSSMPHLPPGNEKLELQMHADMMRAMADVMSKYAARVK